MSSNYQQNYLKKYWCITKVEIIFHNQAVTFGIQLPDLPYHTYCSLIWSWASPSTYTINKNVTLQKSYKNNKHQAIVITLLHSLRNLVCLG